jgi:lipoprotein-anchoring transpeptidase ErfK/SrfK
MSSAILSRRDFLKLGGAAMLGVLSSDLCLDTVRAASLPHQGRVTYTRMKVRASPSFTGEQVGSLVFDDLVDLVGQVSGGVPEDYNRTWYQLTNGSFVYSGGIQPVRSILNETGLTLPEGGMVGEISVPYADSIWGLNRSPSPGPRLYYASAHWVTALVADQRDGSFWYKCYDNLWQSHYYTRPQWVHLLSTTDLAPITPLIPDRRKHIEVVLDDQMLYAFEDGNLVYAARASTGQNGFETPTGWFHTFHKRPTYHMTGGFDASTTFDLPGVPWDSYITDSGVAIHGTYWHNDFGGRHSHGCINLSPEDARWIYRWSSPQVPAGERLVLTPSSGTRVHVLQTREPFKGEKYESRLPV